MSGKEILKSLDSKSKVREILFVSEEESKFVNGRLELAILSFSRQEMSRDTYRIMGRWKNFMRIMS